MRVVLTAAIMDCFHQGHKNILEKMRSRGDKVVVVIHDDKSCYDIKGKVPVQTARHRKRNILLTGLADKVYITKHTDPSETFLKVLHGESDVLFMRGDDNKDFPGKWMIEAHKVPIEYIEYTETVSSTEIRGKVGLHEDLR